MPKRTDGETSSPSLHLADSAFTSQLLTELHIVNFKSFAGSHVIPLAPLTLIYGPNASGKSSIIQSLLLLAQSMQADRFRPKGPLVDVHDFRQVVSRHDSGEELTVGARFRVEEPDRIASFDDDSNEAPPISFEAGIALTFHDVDNERTIGTHAGFDVEGCMLVDPYPTEFYEGFDDETGPWEYLLQSRLDVSEVSTTEALTATLERWYPFLGIGPRDVQQSIALIRLASELVQSGHAKTAMLESRVDPVDWAGGFHTPSGLVLCLEPGETLRAELAAIPVDGRGLCREDQARVEAMLGQWAAGGQQTGYFGGLQPVAKLFGCVEEEARGIFGSDVLPEDQSAAAKRYRERRTWESRPEANLVSLGPIRPKPRRVHIEDDNSDPAELALIRRFHDNDDLVKRVNEWLDRLEIPYSISVDTVVAPTRPDRALGYSLQLVDSRMGVEVSLADVGYGVSQVLPIVAECVGASDSIICIEQPELHLHPRLAGNLAELLVEATSHGNQVIAETHSENVLLRVQRLIRDGMIAASDVAVLYVENKLDVGATVSRLPLDSDGDLQVRWPGGFFDDRLADILGARP